MIAQLPNRTVSPRVGLAVTCAALLAAAVLLAPAAKAEGPCPNESIREGQVSETLPGGTASLPDCMALEMVSPQKKFNQYTKIPAISAGGDRLLFRSVAALADTPKQGSLIDPYIATRTASGWVTQSTLVPAQYTAGYNTLGIPCTYSVDLSRWATWASTETQGKLAITTPLQGALGAPFTPLGPTLYPLNGGSGGDTLTYATGGKCEGGSADASHVFFSIIGIAYLPGDPLPAGDQEDVYEAYRDQNGTPSVALLARDKDGAVYGGSCGVRIGGDSRRGSISPDASRVYFSTRPSQAEGVSCSKAANKLRIFERLETLAGPEISEPISSECTRVAPPCSSADGDDVFQGASQEGDRVLFTTTRQLADSDRDATTDLYLYDSSRTAGARLTQLSAGDDTDPTPGEGAEVRDVPDFAGDGSHVYFVAKGVLTTTANQAGQSAQAGEPNLYLYEYPAGDTAFIGTLSSTEPSGAAATAVPTLGADPEDQSVGGNGHILVFATKESLLPSEDEDGGHVDVYRYDADTRVLKLITKGAPGGEGSGPFDAFVSSSGEEAGPQALSFGRGVSEDGDTVVFSTQEALDPADTNGQDNAYVWRNGNVVAIPFGEEPTVSMAGHEVAFVSDEQLLSEDGDGAKDIYALRVDGGFAPVTPPSPCGGEACQGAPSSQPGDQGISSESVRSGNAKESSCKKGFARKRGRCVKPHRKAKHHRRHDKRPAGHKQGGRK